MSVPGERFTLNLEGVPATIDLEQMGKGTTSIQVESPLRFTASYPSMKLGYRIKRDVDLYDGRVHLGKKSGHTWLGVQGDAIRISLTSTLGVDIRRPTIVPCDSIEFENGTAYASPLALSPPSERTIGMGKSFFPLYVAAREVNPLMIRYSGPFQVLQKRDGWVSLQADWDDGSRLRGWTPERFATSKAIPTESRGGIVGSTISACGGVADGPPLERVTLRKGAVVAASPGGAIWASVAMEISVEVFRLDRAHNGWMQVTAIPGLPATCLEHENIWIRTRDIIIEPVRRSHVGQ